MNNFNGILKIILFNIFVIILLVFAFDLFIYSSSLKNIKHEKMTFEKFLEIYPKNNNPALMVDKIFSEGNKDGILNDTIARTPSGLKYKSSPILILGCSYAFSQFLNENQSFQYKLSELLKRPVYNKSFPGYGLQHMYYLTTTDYFYKQVPPCDTVIYVFIPDHFRRIIIDEFFLGDKNLYLHYENKNHKLIMDNYNNPFFYKKLYSFRALSTLINFSGEYNPENFEKLSDDALEYFLQTRENLQKHWNNNFKFVVFIYESSELTEILSDKLKKTGFVVISSEELTTEDINNSETKTYKLPDGHPNEAAWNLLTPLFVNKLKQDRIL